MAITGNLIGAVSTLNDFTAALQAWITEHIHGQ